MGFSRRESWRGLSCLLQGVFLTQESNSCLLCLLHCRRIEMAFHIFKWVTLRNEAKSNQGALFSQDGPEGDGTWASWREDQGQCPHLSGYPKGQAGMLRARNQWKQTAQKDACGLSRHPGAFLLRGVWCPAGWPREGLVPCPIQAFPDPQLEASLFSSNPRLNLMKPLMFHCVCPIRLRAVRSNRPRAFDIRAICYFHVSLQVSTSPS